MLYNINQAISIHQQLFSMTIMNHVDAFNR
jgi:hypothetical protein